MKKIIIGNDHGGIIVKDAILQHLTEKKVEIIDIGTNTEEIVRYPHYAEKVAHAIQNKEADAGILICSTGIGMSIAANRFKGIRASLCTSHYMAKMTRQHNDSNVLCIGGKITGIFEIIDILDAWLENEFIGDRHLISLGIIEEIENKLQSP